LPPATEQFKHFGIPVLINKLRLLFSIAYTRHGFFVAAQASTGRPGDPSETGDIKAEDGSATDADDTDTDTDTDTDDDTSESGEDARPMREILTRQAIKTVIREAMKAARKEEAAKKAARQKEAAKKAARKKEAAKKAARKVKKAAKKAARETEKEAERTQA
ncbi:hypothetical protein GY45DRAFT_1375851, partial [Cubamyces sp. BRFM 1775]